MKNLNLFPTISVTRVDQGLQAAVGLKLQSILKGSLLLRQPGRMEALFMPSNRLDPREQHKAREAFLHALSGWPPNTTIELHMAALPDLVWRPRGHLWVTLFIFVAGSDEERIKEDIMSAYLTLMPLLGSHLSEAEFVAISTEKELKQRMNPFRQTHALAVCRREETLSLSTPLKRVTVGFGAAAASSDSMNENLIRHVSPWVPSLDTWSRLVDTLMGQLDQVQIVIRLRAAGNSEAALKRLDKVIHTCEVFLSGCKQYDVTLQRQATLVRDTSLRQLGGLGENCFDLGVFILASYPPDWSLGKVLGRAITGPHAFADEADLFQGGTTTKRIELTDARDSGYFPEKEPFTLTEAACAFRLPSPPTEDHPGLPVKRSRTNLAVSALPGTMSHGDIELVLNEHRTMSQPIYSGVEDRMRHTFIIGQTGTGKTTLLERMILQDIRFGRGVALIDPHGDLVDLVLGKIPPSREKDVILFNLVDRERPVGFNLIEWRTMEERDLLIDELYLTLDYLYDMKHVGGPIFESHFRGMLKLLMGEERDEDFIPTLLEFTLCYLNGDFRKWLKGRVEDPVLLDFVEELEKTTGDASLRSLSPYITSKFSRFTNDTTLMRIVGQEQTSFDFDEIMNTGKIFLVNLGKGRFGATVSALIANQLVARFKLAVMKRGDLSLEERRDFFLYVDECHNLPRENFMELLAEARKFRMGLVLVTQYMAQLDSPYGKKDSLLSAILGNVGTTLIFRLGLDDAIRMEGVIQPDFGVMDLVDLPNRQGYARMQASGESLPPFSFTTRRDPAPHDLHAASRIRNASRQRYGRDLDTIDDRIIRRRTFWKEEDPEEDEAGLPEIASVTELFAADKDQAKPPVP